MNASPGSIYVTRPDVLLRLGLLARQVPWYPTQAKMRLEWGTQPLPLVQGVGVKAAVS
jgi:hypothetical protein